MTREEIQAEISRLKKISQKLRTDINDAIRELPQARRDDKAAVKTYHNLNRGGGTHFSVTADHETKLRIAIIKDREELDSVKVQIEELETQLRSQPKPPIKQELEVDGPLMVGTVKMYKDDRGYGFISVKGQPDVFVHISALLDGGELKKGDLVAFKCAKGPRGLQAIDVRHVAEDTEDTEDVW